MRSSQWFLRTLRESPNDAEVISHKLMLRAGLIRKLGSGLYTWLPLGLKVLRKVEQIIREEMNRIFAMEVLMPAVQPAELWQETGRWDSFGGQLLTMKDSNGRDYCFGPTHEEVITDLMRNELRSYKQLPAIFYQIQTKFRDEIRPRFGVMRAREFLMKDAYSFHLNQASLQQSYDKMYSAYSAIFDRLGLHYCAVEADTGAIGGSRSHEFQVLADSGEDLIFFSDSSTYAANVEQARSLYPPKAITQAEEALGIIDTPGLKSIEDLSIFLGFKAEECVKTLIVEGVESSLVALVLRGDDALNEVKAAKHKWVKSPLRFADDETIEKTIGASIGSLGPLNLQIPVVVDHEALALTSFVCGANVSNKHYVHASWLRDVTAYEAFDLRNVKEGDRSPDGLGMLKSRRGIEVGHVFQLGDKYTIDMNASVLNEEGTLQPMLMGCYGIGVSRIVAAAIEQNHDDKGIIWPLSMAPFQLVIIPVNIHRSEVIASLAEKLYQTLSAAGIDVLLDDRNERPGVLFADSDLMGIPHRLVLSERHLEAQCVEYKARVSDEIKMIPLDNIVSFLKDTLH